MTCVFYSLIFVVTRAPVLLPHVGDTMNGNKWDEGKKRGENSSLTHAQSTPDLVHVFVFCFGVFVEFALRVHLLQ